MQKTENYCNSCPDCISCKLKDDVIIEVCDECEANLNDKVYSFDEENKFCYECARQYIIQNVDDFLEEYESRTQEVD